MMELSSFQLMDFEAPVYVGLLTNLSPNHLNWHRDMKEYAAAKRRLLLLSHRRVLRQEVFGALEGVRFSANEDADYTVKGGVLFEKGRFRYNRNCGNTGCSKCDYEFCLTQNRC